MFPTEVSPNVLHWTMCPLDDGSPLNYVSLTVVSRIWTTTQGLHAETWVSPGAALRANNMVLICKTIHEVCASGNPSDPLIEVYQQFFTPFPHFLNRGAEKGLSPIGGRANFRELLEMASHQAWNLIPQVGKTIDIYVQQTVSVLS